MTRPGDNQHVGPVGHRPVDQRGHLGGVVLGGECRGEAPVPFGAAAGRPLAVAGREDEPPGAAAEDAPDAGRELLLRSREDDGAPATILDRRTAVGGHAEAPRALREAVEVEELEVDARVGIGEEPHQVRRALPRAAAEEDRDVERRRHVREELPRRGCDRELAAGRQVEAVVRPLRGDLHAAEAHQQEQHLRGELRPPPRAARHRAQRRPRQRRVSRAKSVKARHPSVNSTR